MKATKKDYEIFYKLHLIKDVTFFLNCNNIEYTFNDGFIINYSSNEIRRTHLIKFLYCCLGIYYIKIIYDNDVYYVYNLNDLKAVQKNLFNEHIHIKKLKLILMPIYE